MVWTGELILTMLSTIVILLDHLASDYLGKSSNSDMYSLATKHVSPLLQPEASPSFEPMLIVQSVFPAGITH